MSIADQITRLNNAKAAIKTSIENKGVVVPDDAKLDSYSTLIDSIEVGSGGSPTGDPAYCETLFNIRTNNNTNYSYLFYSCSNVTSLNFSNWDTSNVTSISRMFYDCSKLISLNLSNWNTSNVTMMDGTFRGCEALTSLDLSSFNTAKTLDMSNMFYGCTKLTTVNLSNFDTTKTVSISAMFRNCTALIELRLDNCSNATIKKIITSSNFPTFTSGTHTIYCKEENASGITAPTGWTFSYVS